MINKKAHESISFTSIDYVGISQYDDIYSLFIKSSKIIYCYFYEQGKWSNTNIKINNQLVDVVFLTDKTNILIMLKIKEKNEKDYLRCSYPTNYSVEKLMLLYEFTIKYLHKDIFLPLFLLTD